MPETMPAIPAEVLAPDPPLSDDALRLAIHDAAMAGGAMAEGHGTQVDQPRPLWTPDGPGSAEWAMAQLRALNGQMAGVQEQARLWRERIDQWEQDAQREPQRRAQFFETALVRYAVERLDADARQRTIHLPSGDVAITVPIQGTVEVADEAAVIRWAQTPTSMGGPPEAPVVKHPPRPAPTVLVSELRKVAKAAQLADGTWAAIDTRTGEVVPGAKAWPPDPPTYRPKPAP